MQPVTSPDEHAESAPERQPAEASTTPAAEEKPWWDDEGMPWKQEPKRADYWCLGWFMFIGVFSLILIPTRAWMIATAPDRLAILTRGRTAPAGARAGARGGGLRPTPRGLAAGVGLGT